MFAMLLFFTMPSNDPFSLDRAESAVPDVLADYGPAKENSQPVSAPAFCFRHIPELDGFRGLAVLIVIVGHYLEYRLPGLSLVFATLDKLGVLLFFVLSGFLITGLLHRERTTKDKIAFRRFYLRRILRLGPALLIFLSAIVILIKLGWVTDVRPKEVLECLLYARNFFGRSLTLGHIWSLSLEEQFYIVWPFLFSALALKRSATYITAACLGFATLRGAMILIKPAAYIQGVYYMRPYYRFDSILIGAALVLWLASSPNVVKKLRGLFSFVPAALFWIGLLLWTGFGERISRAAYLSIQEVLVAAVLAQLVLCDRTFVAAIFRSRILRYFGAISYSLYLWQQLFLVTSTPSWGRMRELPLCVVVPMVIATASFYLIEKPVLQIKESLAP